MTYWFSKDYESEVFFWWEKLLIKGLQWAALSPASKAVFPVLACHANKSGLSYPSEDTISALCGLTPKTVRQGINGLRDNGFTVIDFEKYLTARGRYSKKIKMKLPQANHRDCFPFFRVVLDSGKWRELSASGKALYPVMRCFSFIEFYDCSESEEGPEDNDIFQRDYDKCEAHKSVMAEYAGISMRHINSALNSLIECGLCQQDVISGAWNVFLRTDGRYFKRDYLNKKLSKMRQAHKTESLFVYTELDF